MVTALGVTTAVVAGDDELHDSHGGRTLDTAVGVKVPELPVMTTAEDARTNLSRRQKTTE